MMDLMKKENPLSKKNENVHQLDRRSVRYNINDYVEYENEAYRITQPLDFHEVVGVNVHTKIARRLLIKNLKPISVKDTEDNSYIKRDLEEITDKDWLEAQRRFQAIIPLLQGASRVEIEKHAQELGTHYTTLYRWHRCYLSTGTITGILSHKKGRKSGEIRIPSRVEAIIQEMIDKYYLSKQRLSVPLVIQKVFFQCKQENLVLPGANTIRNRIASVSEYYRLKRQGEAALAKDKYDPKPNHFSVHYPLEIVQMDHTKVDIILVDDATRMPIGRPWVTLAIDIYSRMIVGYYLSLDAPSATSVALCLTNVVMPKDELLLHLDINAEWHVWGKMKTLHVDNGPDFRSDALKKACLVHGIHTNFRPIPKKEYGGHIERLMGTVMKEVHSLPGTTFSNIKERQSYDSDGSAMMTFLEFEKWLVTFITKVYHRRKHAALGMSPEAKWQEGIFGNATKQGTGYPPRPSDSQSFLIDFLPTYARTIQRNGVNIDGLNYYDHALRPFINAIDSDTKKKKQFIFKRDIRDMSHVWFYDETTQTYYKINLANGEIPPMSASEYNEVRKIIGKKNASSISDHEIIEAREELHRQVTEASKKSKKVRRELEKSKIHKARIEIPSVKQSLIDVEEVEQEEDDSLWDDDVPVFD